ncbi:ketohexokinase [Polyplosphaeria fusca]|uniref:Ketohexokinase n=1 Tax=Polyplosphaeria fusca TaxID=682080 RepID=A0A9P4QP14_9PLEO|nr:ketohexokinase [Polyplosphaeria fusca]
MQHIIAVGAVYIDTILTVPHFPGEDQKLRATSLTRRRGGNTANTLEVLQQLLDIYDGDREATEPHLHLLSVLPAKGSESANFIQDSLKGVELDSSVIYREGACEAASSYIIKSQDSGTRTIVNYNELPEMTLDEFVAKVKPITSPGTKNGWYHFEGRIPDVLLPCFRYIRSSRDHCDFKISVEVEKPGREGLPALAAEADVVFFSKLWAEDQGFTSARECLDAQLSYTKQSALLCCTWGSMGATAVQKSLNQAHTWASTDAWKSNQLVVDTIGAGDTFTAGILYGVVYAKDWSLHDTLSFANELAGRKVTQDGFSSLGQAIRHCLAPH